MISSKLRAPFSSYALPSRDNRSLKKRCSSSTGSLCETSLNSPVICDNRTKKLVLDYKRFKAARCIQKYMRGWLERRRYLKKVAAAVIAQTAWRGQRIRRQYVKRAENKVQNELSTYFDDCAIMIQSYYRGWRVRQHICDVATLRFEQTRALIEFLYALAKDFHRLKLEGFIPGVFSVQDMDCYEKVEVFLNILSHRFMNNKVRSSIIYRENFKHQVRRHFKESRYVSESYPGPNFEGTCPYQFNPELYKHYNKRTIQLINEYEKAFHPKELRTKETNFTTDEKKHLILKSQDRQFCEDMITNIQKWPKWVIEGTYLSKSRSKRNKPKLLSEAHEIYNNIDIKHWEAIQPTGDM